MLCRDDILDRGDGALDGVVHDDVLIAPADGDLFPRASHAPREALLRLGTAAAQAVLQLLDGRRQQEDEQPVRAFLHDVQGALNVDLEQDILPRRAPLLDLLERRPVVVAVDIRMLEEASLPDELLELLLRQKVVVLAIHLAVPRRARRGGDGVGKLRCLREELAAHGSLACAGRAGYDDQHSLPHTSASRSSSAVSRSSSTASSLSTMRCATVSGCTAERMT